LPLISRMKLRIFPRALDCRCGHARIGVQQAQNSAVHIIKISGPNILRRVI
jgi:hypothetical protein